jgi:hypothetical protein
MCELSTKLKLCTCGAASVSELRNYWILYRFDKAQDCIVAGSIVSYDEPSKTVQANNRALLLERLHEADAFDVDLRPREGDRLQLTFTCSEPGGRVKTLYYGYEYKSGRWTEEEYDELSWERKHYQAKFGKVQPALKGE